jgi:uncharacterized coiled-coil DUF342 family protein
MRSDIKLLRENQRQSKMILDALVSNNSAADILNRLRNGEGLEEISNRL